MNNPTPARTGHPIPPTDSEYVDLLLASTRAEAAYKANPTQENFDAWYYAAAMYQAALIRRQDAARGKK